MAIQSRDSQSEHYRMEHARAGRYWLVFGALLAGTVATVLVARVHLPPPYGLLTALAIAVAKSSLVVLFFMHLWDHGGANRLVFATSVVFVALLVGLVVLDSASRFPLLNPGRGPTLRMEPPGPDILSPRDPPGAERWVPPAPAGPREGR
jgi:cytochrome c oxidase subunit 4